MEMCHFVPLQSHANCKFCAGYITSWLTSYDAVIEISERLEKPLIGCKMCFFYFCIFF